MAIHKVLGIETEYGIFVRNAPEQNPQIGRAHV